MSLGLSFGDMGDKINPKLRSAEERRAEFVKFFPQRGKTIINYAASRITEEDEGIVMDMAVLYGNPADPDTINDADKEWLRSEIFVSDRMYVQQGFQSDGYHPHMVETEKSKNLRSFVDACYDACVGVMEGKMTREIAAENIDEVSYLRYYSVSDRGGQRRDPGLSGSPGGGSLPGSLEGRPTTRLGGVVATYEQYRTSPGTAAPPFGERPDIHGHRVEGDTGTDHYGCIFARYSLDNYSAEKNTRHNT